MNRLRKPLFGGAKIACGLLLLWLSLRGVEWSQLVSALEQLSISLLLLTLLVVLLGLGLKAFRWRLLLRNFHVNVPSMHVLEALLAGQAANIALPARGGEVVRLGYLAADEPGLSPQILASIVVEKALDAAALAISGLLVSAYLPVENSAWIRSWLLPGSMLALILLALLALRGEALYRWLQRRIPDQPPQWLAWIDGQVSYLVKGMRELREARRLLPLLALTLLIWFVMGATNQLLLYSLELPGGVPACLVVLVLVHIGLLPALMPGNIGPFYFFAQLALVPFAISADQGLAFAILLHALITLPPLLLGGTLLLRSGRSTLLVRNSTS